MIRVSESARFKLAQLAGEEGKQPADVYLKVGVTSGGCSGLSYKMDLVDAPADGDQIYEDAGVRILVDKKSLLYLAGTVLEYSGGLNGKGFSFNNPNAARTCGCGESFSL
jgi:iron-sulfur cluster assembly protein